MIGTWPPEAWTYNQVVDDLALNAFVSANFTDLAGPMDVYTPVWTAATTNPVLGNGTLVGKFRQAYKAVDFVVALTMGSTTTYGTGAGYTISLPVAADPSFNFPNTGLVIDASTGDNYVIAADTISVAGALRLRQIGTGGLVSTIGATAPMAFATGDRILLGGRYWIA